MNVPFPQARMLARCADLLREAELARATDHSRRRNRVRLAQRARRLAHAVRAAGGRVHGAHLSGHPLNRP